MSNAEKEYLNILKKLNANPDNVKDWSHMTLELSYVMPFEIFIENKHLNWDWKIISKKILYKFELVANNLDIDWDWEIISENIKDTYFLEKIKNYKHLPFNWDIISENINKVIKYTNYNLDDISLGYFTVDEFNNFLKYVNLPWNWDIIYYNLPKNKKDKLDVKRF
jgi:hypothetical protein